MQYKTVLGLYLFLIIIFTIVPFITQTFLSYQIGNSVKIDPELVIVPDSDGKNNVLHIKLDWEGCFNAVVKYNGVPISQGQFTVISLNCKLFVAFLLLFLPCNKTNTTQNNVNQNYQNN